MKVSALHPTKKRWMNAEVTKVRMRRSSIEVKFDKDGLVATIPVSKAMRKRKRR
jgi:hypothetical protein